MTNPQVTVVLPTYNWATVLPLSIGSVLDQTFTDFELLVIGDACTDESEQVVTAIDDGRLRWINLATRVRHQAGPNNEGLRQARGDVIAYIGHDDLWLPRHLERLVQAIDEEHVFAHGRLVNVSPDQVPGIRPSSVWAYSRGAWITPTSVAHRREAALAVGGWRLPRHTGTLLSEADLWARLFDKHGAPALVPLVTSVKFPASQRKDVYRQRPSHEQAEWLRRIRDSPDPEHEFLGAFDDVPTPAAGTSARFALRAVRKLRRAGKGLLGYPRGTAEYGYRKLLTFKGVDD